MAISYRNLTLKIELCSNPCVSAQSSLLQSVALKTQSPLLVDIMTLKTLLLNVKDNAVCLTVKGQSLTVYTPLYTECISAERRGCKTKQFTHCKH